MQYNKKQKVHLIAVGGSVMHNLALALNNLGWEVSGSDDNIYEPSASRLKEANIYPDQLGWHPERIVDDLDAVILGMHAKKDNPELLEAQKKNIRIFSFPEFIHELSQNKHRIVIAGSHGKTTVTSIIMHVLKYFGKSFDYLVGAQNKGFDVMVSLSDAPLIILEGDEYLSSALDPSPKFLHYHHHIGVITGIAWDHYNVYPSYDEYVEQFVKFSESTPKAGTIIFNRSDDTVRDICQDQNIEDVAYTPYEAHPHKVIDGKTVLITNFGDIPLEIFGKHNMENLAAAKEVVKKVGITDLEFYEAMQHFTGASNRLELIKETDEYSVYLDFAHSPSKVRASISALKNQFPDKNLVTVLELHSFSSLNEEFLPQYKDTLLESDEPLIFINQEVAKEKNNFTMTDEDIVKAFNDNRIKVHYVKETLEEKLLNDNYKNTNILLMSSGNFADLPIDKIGE
ncbi:UDP-N-acetylmuramate--L-alanine ligase [Aureibacter tunicatorum]|uniref:UDP-N-acetylmuramate: L-alanyl-gamma-D-glutamyl-meso-diaminopimelate ligase n=1 Tax=Aureibacter tunicatorum TaxID=866807 RepID=A0AAE3XNQ1_9BACT|nr:Mur ligase family protein [Aureibacter tunicatorum]MDR6239235.1 UDP-N-acetylmuramate: L-alanyl-gamma-D-glutamyl-meso-diaminopimelate ligase [Aureibacter tunicatorum]BDD04840.1 peptidoglycan synthetase [Aureibacter tunicatorum]